ncbi:phosphotransferase enzyme family protein [Paenibacillus sp. sgz5001063]|uniref:phosphotransferase enzyme family protein n=1 Tax=Paenibacillus sp. sgz5001063 TaxID=3242474 RepID=UPI0036D25BD4
METIVSEIWPQWTGTLEKRSGGWNNTTYIVNGGARKSILRIYDTHRDREKIEFEHALLQKLGKLALPFKIPVPVCTPAGETVVQLKDADGKFACLFKYIDGDSPSEGDSGYLESFGEAAGVLSSTLADIHAGLSPVYKPYYELRQAYPLCSADTIRELCLKPAVPFAELAQELNMLYEAYDNIAGSLTELQELPHQLVHGDLNASNLLVETTGRRQVAALLDFEFCTYDVRAMEPAVVLSGLLGHAEERAAVQAFCRGFSRHIHLTEAEIKAIPVLMLLRKVDVFLHFVTRYLEGTDEAHVLQEQVKLLAEDLIQLSAGTTLILEILKQEQEGI